MCVHSFIFAFSPLYRQDVSSFSNKSVKMCRLLAWAIVCVCVCVCVCVHSFIFAFSPLYRQDVSSFGNTTVKMCRLSAIQLSRCRLSAGAIVCVCVCVYVCVCVCVCTCVQVLSLRMPPGCQHIWTVMDYLGLGCYSKRETPATGGGGVHIKFIGDLSILVVCSLSCHCVATVWHSEDCVVCCHPQLR